MGKENLTINQDFEQIITLIQAARNRIYSKANSELVLLYFNVGKVVFDSVKTGKWGEKTVQELADFIALQHPELSGFNRRGLYRMKQFYETYSDSLFVTTVMTQIGMDETEKVSPAATQSEKFR